MTSTNSLAEHAEAVIDLIVSHGHGTTFVEISNLLAARGMDTDGDLAVGPIDACPNLYAWIGMSRDFVEIMKAVQGDGRVEIHSSSVLTYMFDGRALTLPIAKKPPKNGYREPHWAPVCFSAKARTAGGTR